MSSTIEVVVNGHAVQVEDADSISYEQLATLAGENPERTLSIIYDVRGGVNGSIFPGKRGPLIGGCRYNVADTSNA